MAEPTDPQISGQAEIDIPAAEPAPVAPGVWLEEVPAEPDPTAEPAPDAAQEVTAPDAEDVTSADSVPETEPSPHRFRIIHELHGGPGADIIRIGEELATDAETAIKFLTPFVTKS